MLLALAAKYQQITSAGLLPAGVMYGYTDEGFIGGVLKVFTVCVSNYRPLAQCLREQWSGRLHTILLLFLFRAWARTHTHTNIYIYRYTHTEAWTAFSGEMEIKKRKRVIDSNVKLQIMKKYNFGVADGSRSPIKILLPTACSQHSAHICTITTSRRVERRLSRGRANDLSSPVCYSQSTYSFYCIIRSPSFYHDSLHPTILWKCDSF